MEWKPISSEIERLGIAGPGQIDLLDWAGQLEVDWASLPVDPIDDRSGLCSDEVLDSDTTA
jgi:hypothetical protein